MNGEKIEVSFPRSDEDTYMLWLKETFSNNVFKAINSSQNIEE
jgi:hypothetical protein